MSGIKKEILERIFPDYISAKATVDSYSNYELYLVRDNLPNTVDELGDCILKEVQWDILGTLFSRFIDDWDHFYEEFEGELMDYCNDATLIRYNYGNKSYTISKDDIIDACRDLVRESIGYSLNEDVDFRDVIADLNEFYPIKFCEA